MGFGTDGRSTREEGRRGKERGKKEEIGLEIDGSGISDRAGLTAEGGVKCVEVRSRMLAASARQGSRTPGKFGRQLLWICRTGTAICARVKNSSSPSPLSSPRTTSSPLPLIPQTHPSRPPTRSARNHCPSRLLAAGRVLYLVKR